MCLVPVAARSVQMAALDSESGMQHNLLASSPVSLNPPHDTCCRLIAFARARTCRLRFDNAVVPPYVPTREESKYSCNPCISSYRTTYTSLVSGHVPAVFFHSPPFAGWDARTCFQRHWLAQAWSVDVVQSSSMPRSPAGMDQPPARRQISAKAEPDAQRPLRSFFLGSA